MAKKILIAEIMHETNTFNKKLTTKADFASRYYLLGDEVASRLKNTNSEICGFMDIADELDWHIECPFAASASPSGPMSAPDWAEIKSHILKPLVDGKCVFDALILVLHGSMVTQCSDDPEGELLAQIREYVGDAIPVVVTLDMHANVSKQMLDHANLLMAYRTYPHVDQYERAQHLARLLDAMLTSGQVTKSYQFRRAMMDGANHGQTAVSPENPMPQLLAKAQHLEQSRDGVMCASIQIGFPWADVADIGPSIIVSGLDEHACREVGQELLDDLWTSRLKTQLDFCSPDKAIEKARQGKPGEAPLMLADFADNPAGGAYGDSCNLLKAMIDASLKNAAFATICDPQAVQVGFKAGLGQIIDIELGGKYVPQLTPPLPLYAKVMYCGDGHFICDGPMWRGVSFEMGDTLVIRVDDIDIVVTSVPIAVMDQQVFLSVGIDPKQKTTIGLKSRNHFKAAYQPIARECLLVDAGGIASMQLNKLPYKNIPRPIWPLDEMT